MTMTKQEVELTNRTPGEKNREEALHTTKLPVPVRTPGKSPSKWWVCLDFVSVLTVLYMFGVIGFSAGISIAAFIHMRGSIALLRSTYRVSSGECEGTGFLCVSAKAVGLRTLAVCLRLASTLQYQGYLPADFTGDGPYQLTEIVFVICSFKALRNWPDIAALKRKLQKQKRETLVTPEQLKTRQVHVRSESEGAPEPTQEELETMVNQVESSIEQYNSASDKEESSQKKRRRFSCCGIQMPSFTFMNYNNPEDSQRMGRTIFWCFFLGLGFAADLDNRIFYDSLWMTSQALEAAALMTQVTLARKFSKTYFLLESVVVVDTVLREPVLWFWIAESLSALYWFGFSGVREFDNAAEGLTAEGIFLFMTKLVGFMFAWECFDTSQQFWLETPRQHLNKVLQKAGNFV
ncbi:unnamed protein product [Amoebophrya sp. A25]|nr:unnamed protein product [Amoebophrya sp. A25]|eukprot:GSA25T00013336001.1